MIPGLLAAGSTLLGAYMTAGGNKDASREAGKWNQINQASAQAHADKWNTLAQNNFQDQMRNRLTYLAGDAKRAGISPLAALGAAGSSPMGFTAGMPNARQGAVHNSGAVYGAATARAGQQLADEITREKRTQERRETRAFNENITGAKLQNELARTRLLEEKFNLHAKTTMAGLDSASRPRKAYIDLVQNAGDPLPPGMVRVMGPEMSQGTEGLLPAFGSAAATTYGTGTHHVRKAVGYVRKQVRKRKHYPGRGGRWDWNTRR